SYNATVTATDGINSTTQNITVAVTDANDSAPVFTSNPNFSAAENQTVIGTIAASDPEGDDVSFAISGSELLITPGGALTFASAPDYETKSAYSATVTATDGINVSSQDISVLVNNLNDNNPVFTSSAALNVDENQNSVGFITAMDADGDTINFALPNPDQPGWTQDRGQFTLNSSTGLIAFNNSFTPNFEVKNSYTFNVFASDEINSVMQTIELTLNDLNDSPQLTGPYSISVEENQTSIETMTASDEDNDTLVFTVSGTDSASINIDSSSGAMTFASPPNYETKPSYSVTVTVSDGIDISSANLSISIININESDPTFTSADTFNVNENQTTIGTVTAVDSIDNETLTYKISSFNGITTSSGIDINSTTGELSFNNWWIENSGVNDYETYSSHTITVTAQDSFVTSSQDISVKLININDNSPLFTAWCSSLRADENQTTISNCVTGDSSIEATDADGDSLTFSMTSEEGLSISSGGILSFSSPPDFETDWLRSGVVRVTDGLNTTTSPINVYLNNLNDNAPTFASQAVSFAKNERAWNSGCILTCSEVGAVSATDADYDAGFNGGEGFEFSYSIISQEHVNSFEIDASTGVIRSLDPHLDYETDANYTLTVQASDGELSNTQDVTVNVSNIDEGPYVSSSTNLSINENETLVATITADDYEGYSSNNPISIHIMRNGGGGNECQSGLEADDCEFFSLETLSSGSARLTMTAPNFESPQDSDQNNVYRLSIGLSMGNPRCGYHYPYCGQAFDFSVIVNNVNDAPYLRGFSRASSSDTIAFEGTAPNITAVTVGSVENKIDSGTGLLTKEIVTLTTKDDDGDYVACSVSGADASLLVAQTYGPDGCRIYTSSYADYETRSSYSAVLKFSDGTSNQEISLTINVIDVDD
ncbi:cadherin repeat domain-containing protein, partial [Pseudomonadales bacterium]|nr:cadherin repeat domain-containing protein [Pseudomonadales bacterium]